MSASTIPRFDPELDRGAASRALQLQLAFGPLRRLVSYVAQHHGDAFLHWLARSPAGAHLPLPFGPLLGLLSPGAK